MTRRQCRCRCRRSTVEREPWPRAARAVEARLVARAFAVARSRRTAAAAALPTRRVLRRRMKVDVAAATIVGR